MPIEWSVELHEEVESTQNLIKNMAQMNEPEGRVVQALRQNRGYGRHGRKWYSDPGNLYMSLLLRPDCHVQMIPQLSLVASLAVYRAMATFMDNPDLVVLKWPNDVLIGNDKVAGILLETELKNSGAVKWLAMGIGINIQKAPDGLGVALQDFCLPMIDLIEFRTAVLTEFSIAYTAWTRNKFDQIKKEWLEKAHKKDTPVEVKIGAQIERGYFHDLDDGGNMIVRDKDFRTKVISAGEVHFLNKH